MKYLQIAEDDCNKIKINILTVNDRIFFGRIVEHGKRNC